MTKPRHRYCLSVLLFHRVNHFRWITIYYPPTKRNREQLSLLRQDMMRYNALSVVRVPLVMTSETQRSVRQVQADVAEQRDSERLLDERLLDGSFRHGLEEYRQTLDWSWRHIAFIAPTLEPFDAQGFHAAMHRAVRSLL